MLALFRAKFDCNFIQSVVPYVGFNCKGCVIKRECVKTQAIEDKRVFASSSRLSIPRNDSCDLHMLECEELGQDGDNCVS